VALHLNKLPCFTIKEKRVYHPGKQHLGIYCQYPLVTDQGLAPFTFFRKNIYTEEYLRKLGLNDRQQKAVHHVKTTGKITNQELRDLTDVVIRTASRDLEDLVRKGVLVKMGKTGRSTHYVLACKLDTNRTNRT
jgi:hypothetical protein